MKALVMLEERPVIFIGVGMRNNDKYSIEVRSNSLLLSFLPRPILARR